MMLTRKAYAFLAIGIFILFMSPQVVKADIVGNTYSFTIVWNDQTFQQDGGPVFQSKDDGQFTINVYNATQIGGDDVYEYNYNGYNWFIVAYYENHNDTVEFLENYVEFSLSTVDIDGNNRSEGTSLTIYPTAHYAHPGRNLFINPVWSTHNTGWSDSVDDLEDNGLVHDIIESANSGEFSLEFNVDVEAFDQDLGQMNGTTSYTYSSNYDEDGILFDWSLTRRTYLQNENHTVDQTNTQRISRTSGTGPGIILPDVPLVLAGAIGVVALVVGAIIGRKMSI